MWCGKNLSRTREEKVEKRPQEKAAIDEHGDSGLLSRYRTDLRVKWSGFIRHVERASGRLARKGGTADYADDTDKKVTGQVKLSKVERYRDGE